MHDENNVNFYRLAILKITVRNQSSINWFNGKLTAYPSIPFWADKETDKEWQWSLNFNKRNSSAFKLKPTFEDKSSEKKVASNVREVSA